MAEMDGSRRSTVEQPEVRRALERDLALMRSELERQRRKLLVVILPVKYEILDTQNFGEPRRMLIGLLDELGIDFLDLHDEFAALENLDEYFLPADAVHMTHKGNALVADALSEALATYLPP